MESHLKQVQLVKRATACNDHIYFTKTNDSNVEKFDTYGSSLSCFLLSVGASVKKTDFTFSC